MRFDGRWARGADGVERPAIDVDLLLPGGQVLRTPFLVDTGADTTVLSYEVALQLAAFTTVSPGPAPASGVGGAAATQVLAADLVFTAADNRRTMVRGPLLAFASPSTIDLCVLGRDVIDLCDLVYSRRRGIIALLTASDGFAIV